MVIEAASTTHTAIMCIVAVLRILSYLFILNLRVCPTRFRELDDEKRKYGQGFGGKFYLHSPVVLNVAPLYVVCLQSLIGEHYEEINFEKGVVGQPDIDRLEFVPKYLPPAFSQLK